jgi:hypothetical protein
MPNLILTPDEASRFRPLPGRALLKCLPPLDNPHELIVKPETAAQAELERMAVRRGEVVRICWTGDRPLVISKKTLIAYHNETEYLDLITSGAIDIYGRAATVYYLGHADETDNEYVVVKILQIVAVEIVPHNLKPIKTFAELHPMKF